METPVKSKKIPETFTIRGGTTLYRGDTPFYIANNDVQSKSLEKKATFFGLEPDDVKQYGIIHSWTVPQDIELLHLDNPEVMKRVYDQAPEHVKDVLENNYGYDPKTNIIGYSSSIFERDRIFYEYLCTTGSPGYASTRYEGEEISLYEVMVCDPTNFVFYDVVLPSGVTDEPSYIASEIEKYNERINPKDKIGKKKRPQESVVETPPSKFMAFASSPDEYSQVEYSQVEYSSEGQVMYSPLRISKGKDSPIKMMTGTLFDSPVKGALFDSPVKGALFPSPVKGALFPSPKKGGSRKRKVIKTRKTKRGKQQSRKSRSK
jgi:hypothetical protein